jgi:carbamoyltransferase
MYIQPSAGDAGSSLGAAFYVNHGILGNPRQPVMDHAYYGQSFSDHEIRSFLDEHKIPYTYFDTEDALVEHVSAALADSKVAGWFHGRFEWGPRALGSRSIIANPASEEMKDVVNVKIKFREPYRPFAPSVLAEKAEEYFELPDAMDHYPARFMLYVTQVKEDKKAKVPAITHVDGSARPQLVYKATNPRYYKLIEAFERKTGIPLVMNTSFNLKGEPIVTTPANAYKTFMASGLDLLVLENFVVTKAQ